MSNVFQWFKSILATITRLTKSPTSLHAPAFCRNARRLRRRGLWLFIILNVLSCNSPKKSSTDYLPFLMASQYHFSSSSSAPCLSLSAFLAFSFQLCAAHDGYLLLYLSSLCTRRPHCVGMAHTIVLIISGCGVGGVGSALVWLIYVLNIEWD